MRPSQRIGRRRDWFVILRDLMKAGVSMAQVARQCGREKGSVMHWSNGGEPRESDARIVLALYAAHCPTKYLSHQAQFEIKVAEVSNDCA